LVIVRTHPVDACGWLSAEPTACGMPTPITAATTPWSPGLVLLFGRFFPSFVVWLVYQLGRNPG
jgi:hypothetical protein